MKIGLKLILAFLAIILLLGLLGNLSSKMSRKALETSIGEHTILWAHQILERLEEIILHRIESLQRFTSEQKWENLLRSSNDEFGTLVNIREVIDQRDREWTAAGKETVTPFMQELLDTPFSEDLRREIDFYRKNYGYNFFGELFITNKYGANVAQSGKTPDYKQDDEQWWQITKQNGYFIGEVEYDKSAGINSVALGVRIDSKDGEFLGVLKAVLNSKEIITILDHAKEDSKYISSDFILFKENGELIYETQGTLPAQAVSDLLSPLFHPDQATEGYLIAPKTGKSNNNEHLISFFHFKQHEKLRMVPWILAIMHDTREIFAPIAILRKRIFLISLIAIIFSILTGLFISNSITKSLQKLGEAADEIGKGNLDTPINITARDEVGQLAATVKSMALNLKMVTASRNQLNKEIAERKKAEKENKQNYQQQEILNNLLAFSWEHVSLEKILDSVIEQIVAIPWLTAEAKGAVFLVKDDPNVLVMIAQRGLPDKLAQEVCARVPFGRCLCGQAALSGEIVFANIIDERHEIRHEGMEPHGHYCIPIISSRKKILGVITLYTEANVLHNDRAEQFLGTLSQILANIVERKGAERDLAAANKTLIQNEKAMQNMLVDLQRNHEEMKAKEQELLALFQEAKKANEQLKETQSQLVQSEKLASLGQLSAGVAHEINNPIGFISSNIETLEQYIEGYSEILRAAALLRKTVEDKDFDKALSAAKEINNLEEKINLSFIMGDIDNLLRESKSGIERIKKIVQDLRTFARKDEGQMELNNLEEVLDGIINIVWNEIKYKAELKKEYGSVPLVRCNAQRIGQVFINLLVNASQAIKADGEITIKTYTRDRSVCIEISDTGCGIAREHIDKIFDPFFTTKDVGKGTGLGLSVSYDIIKQNKGDIAVESELNKGTRFIIKFPLEGKESA